MIFMGVFFIVVTIFLHFFDEKPIPIEHQTTFKEIMGAVSSVCLYFFYFVSLKNSGDILNLEL